MLGPGENNWSLCNLPSPTRPSTTYLPLKLNPPAQMASFGALVSQWLCASQAPSSQSPLAPRERGF